MDTIQKIAIGLGATFVAVYGAMTGLMWAHGGTQASIAPKDIAGQVKEVSVEEGYFTVPLGRTDVRIHLADAPQGLEGLVKQGDHVTVTGMGRINAGNFYATVLNAEASLQNVKVAQTR